MLCVERVLLVKRAVVLEGCSYQRVLQSVIYQTVMWFGQWRLHTKESGTNPSCLHTICRAAALQVAAPLPLTQHSVYHLMCAGDTLCQQGIVIIFAAHLSSSN